MLHRLIRTSDYQDWVWDLTRRLRSRLEAAYSKRLGEVDCIREMVKEVGQTKPISSPHSPEVRVTVDSAFLHGSRSQVRFSVAGIEKQRELADVLVIGSFVERASLKWQRVCLIQAKRGSGVVRRSVARFDVDEWQLELLRTFPSFMGVSGVFKGLTFQLRNQSGMLGAYGLLNSPGDISVVSARVLYSALGGRKSLTGKELLPAILSEPRQKQPWLASPPPLWWPIDPEHCLECRKTLELFLDFPWQQLWQHRRLYHIAPFPSADDTASQPATSRLTCLTLEEFVESWTSLQLGELWFADSKTSGDASLQQLALSLVARVGGTSGSLQHLRSLITSASGVEPPRRERENILQERSESGGLIVLSAIATAGGEE